MSIFGRIHKQKETNGFAAPILLLLIVIAVGLFMAFAIGKSNLHKTTQNQSAKTGKSNVQLETFATNVIPAYQVSVVNDNSIGKPQITKISAQSSVIKKSDPNGQYKLNLLDKQGAILVSQVFSFANNQSPTPASDQPSVTIALPGMLAATQVSLITQSGVVLMTKPIPQVEIEKASQLVQDLRLQEQTAQKIALISILSDPGQPDLYPGSKQKIPGIDNVCRPQNAADGIGGSINVNAYLHGTGIIGDFDTITGFVVLHDPNSSTDLADDPILPCVKVSLYRDNILLASVLSANNPPESGSQADPGFFGFLNVPKGSYTIKIDSLSGYTILQPNPMQVFSWGKEDGVYSIYDHHTPDKNYMAYTTQDQLRYQGVGPQESSSISPTPTATPVPPSHDCPSANNSICGYVKDNTGKVIANISVGANCNAPCQAASAITGSDGYYEFANLQSTTYDVGIGPNSLPQGYSKASGPVFMNVPNTNDRVDITVSP